jgi:TolB-like protein/Tfp pilus assembly protein PilF
LFLLALGGWWLQHLTVEPTAANPAGIQSASLLPNSIAVLPFTDLSPEHDQGYFSHGISEELLNRLGETPGLHVIGRTSSFSFEDSGYDLAQISSLLRVAYVLEGSVRKDGRRLRISARLSDAAGIQLWNETYDRELREIFDLQEEIAEAVARSVVPRVALKPTGKSQQPDIDAYQHFLVGREILHSRVANFDNLAAQEFRQAIAIDANYVDAHAELAIALTFASDRDWNLREGSVVKKKYAEAGRAIAKALAIDPQHARAYAAQGFHSLHTGESREAELALRQAIDRDPGMADAAYWLAAVLTEQGSNEGWELLQRTALIDPLLPELNSDLALGYAERGDFVQAESTFRRLLAVRRPAMWAYSLACDYFVDTGRLAEAVATAKLMVLETSATPVQAISLDELSQAYSELDMNAEAQQWLNYKESHHWYAGFTLEKMGRFADILALWERLRESKGITIGDEDIRHVRYVGHIQALAGNYRQAIEILESATEGAGPDREFGDRRVTLAFAYMKTGAEEDALFLLDELLAEWRQRELRGLVNYSPDLLEYALVHLLRGNIDRALYFIQRAYDAGWRSYYALINDPRWEDLLADPRSAALMKSARQDVELQREQVQRMDAEDGFYERVNKLFSMNPQSGLL